MTAEMHHGQLRFAERLANQYGDRLRFAHGIGWLRWDGTRWAPDRDGAPQRAVVTLVKAALRSMDTVHPDDRRQLLGDIRRCESAAGMSGVLTIAQALRPLAVAADALDADPHLFNCTNGTLNLRTGALRPHDPADLITKVAGCGLDTDAHGPVFDKFLTEILPDGEVRGFVQRLFGSAMFGAVRDHVLPILTGTGCNGKTTLVELIRDAFGEYAIAAEPDLLIDRGYTHPTGQADLLGVRLAVTAESDEGSRLAAATVKRLTGGDKIRARRMRENYFEFSPSHTIVMVTNRLPVVRGDDPALWRRLAVVPFDVTITNVDLDMPVKLRTELPAVLTWMVAGHRQWQDIGLAPPGAVSARTDAYQRDSDPIAQFLDECTMRTPAGHVAARDLYSAWIRWCVTAEIREPISEKSFAVAMERHGIDRPKRTSAGMRYVGLTLLAASTGEPNG